VKKVLILGVAMLCVWPAAGAEAKYLHIAEAKTAIFQVVGTKYQPSLHNCQHLTGRRVLCMMDWVEYDDTTDTHLYWTDSPMTVTARRHDLRVRDSMGTLGYVSH